MENTRTSLKRIWSDGIVVKLVTWKRIANQKITCWCCGWAILLFIESSLDSWVMKSRVSFHITSNRDVFENYIVGAYRKVFPTDGKHLGIVGRVMLGWICQMDMSENQQNQACAKLTRNLISVGHLNDEEIRWHLVIVIGNSTNESWSLI